MFLIVIVLANFAALFRMIFISKFNKIQVLFSLLSINVVFLAIYFGFFSEINLSEGDKLFFYLVGVVALVAFFYYTDKTDKKK